MSAIEMQVQLRRAHLEVHRAAAGYRALLDELEHKLRVLEERIARAKTLAAAERPRIRTR
jgi:hypothetical protein